MKNANISEVASYYLVTFFSGTRLFIAMILGLALIGSSMFFNASYGWTMGDSQASKIMQSALMACLDPSLAYLSAMAHMMVRDYGKGWYALYPFCALLLASSIFTLMAYFSANSASIENKKTAEIDAAIIDVALTNASLASESVEDWNDKLETTRNNTTSWNKQKQAEAERIDRSLAALQEIKKSKSQQIHESDAVFQNYGIANQKNNIKAFFAGLITIAGVLVVAVLSRDLWSTRKRIAQDSAKSMNKKEKPKIQSRKSKKTTQKETPDIKTHKEYERIKQAVLKRELSKPSKKELLGYGVGAATAGAMLKDFYQEGLITMGNRGYEYVEKVRAV